MDDIFVEGTHYTGHVIEVPVFRPGQRYTELNRASRSVCQDLITHAILNKPLRVTKKNEERYEELVTFRNEVASLLGV